MSIEEQTAAESTEPVGYVDGDQVHVRYRGSADRFISTNGEPDIATMLSQDAIEKINAGAKLVYALYHRDAEWWKDQPLGVTRAYVRASKAYGLTAR